METINLITVLTMSNVVLVGVNIIFFFSLFSRIQLLSKYAKQVELGPEKLLKHISKKVDETIAAVSASFAHTIRSAQLYKEDAEVLFKRELEANMRSLQGQTDAVITQSGNTVVSAMQKATDAQLARMQEAYTQAMQTITEDMLHKQQELSQLLTARQAEVERSIAAYKQMRKQQIEEQITEQVAATIRKVLPDVLTVSQHQEIIVKRLKEEFVQGALAGKS